MPTNHYAMSVLVPIFNVKSMINNFPEFIGQFRVSEKFLFLLANSQRISATSIHASRLPVPGSPNTYDLSWGFSQSWAAGVQYHFSPDLRLGLSFRNVRYGGGAFLIDYEQTRLHFAAAPQKYIVLDFGAQYDWNRWHFGLVLRNLVQKSLYQSSTYLTYNGQRLTDMSRYPGIQLEPGFKAELGVRWAIWPEHGTQLLMDVTSLSEMALGAQQRLLGKAVLSAGVASRYDPIDLSNKVNYWSAGLEYHLKGITFGAVYGRPFGAETRVFHMQNDMGAFKMKKFYPANFLITITLVQ
ncbi:MAG: hypothetical protein Q9P14_10970 [candidate division KSB1 bacterium]|nr:hypothetical protein [candidate division KSB1 bacterium]